MPHDYLSTLPTELLTLITSHLTPIESPGSLTALSLTCKSLYDRFFPEHLWAPRIAKAKRFRSRYDNAETVPFLRLLERDLSPQWEFCALCGSLHDGCEGLREKHKVVGGWRRGGSGVEKRPFWGPRNFYSRGW